MGNEPSGPPEPPNPDKMPAPAGTMQKAAGLSRAVMSAAPLGSLAVGMVVGIVAGERTGAGLSTFLSMLSVASTIALIPLMRARLSAVLVFAAGTGLGGTLDWSRQQVLPTSVEHVVASGETIVRLRGQITSEPKNSDKNDDDIFSPWQFREEQTAFLLRVESIRTDWGWRPASGTIKATVREAVLDLEEGDSIELFGKLVDLDPPKNPGAFDWRAYYRQQGVVARMFCDQRENIVRLGSEGPGFASWLRVKTRGLLTDDISASAAEEASLLEAMVLGHRSRFDRRLNEVFTRAGCVHFIAASGTNIVVLMGALWFTGRMIGLGKRRCAWLMIVAIVLYGVVAEARPPILRACVMGLMFCIALLLQRASSHFNWISAATIALCLFDPLTVFDVGFQLSFMAVLGVAYLAPAILHAGASFYWWFRHVALRDPYAAADLHLRKIAEQFAPLNARQRFRRTTWRFGYVIAVVCAVSLGAWLVSLPITARWFQRIQPWGVISSVLVYPLMSAVMVLGVLKVGVAAISPTTASVVTGALWLLDTVTVRVVEWMAQLPATSPIVSAPPWWLIVSFYVFLLAFTLAFRRKRAPTKNTEELAASIHPPSRRFIGVLVSLTILAASSCTWHFNVAPPSALTVTVLAVGAGSAVIMQLPDGETILYDAGSLGMAGVGRNVIAPYLRSRGIRAVSRLYVSHPNLDHFSGIPELMAEIPTGPVIWNQCFEKLSPSRSPAARLVEHLRSEHHPVQTLHDANTWEVGGVQFEKLWPVQASCTSLSANDSSTVLKITYAGHSILFTGDIEEEAERALMGRMNLEAEVLLLPHHGSVCAATSDFLREVQAKVLIRSSNQRVADTSNGLQKLVGEARLYNTADCGAVTILIDNNGMQVESWLACDLK
jgi:competence protein ComEC